VPRDYPIIIKNRFTTGYRRSILAFPRTSTTIDHRYFARCYNDPSRISRRLPLLSIPNRFYLRAIWHGLMMLGDGGDGAALAQYIRFDTSPIQRSGPLISRPAPCPRLAAFRLLFSVKRRSR